MNIKIKRAYEQPHKDDGLRVLVDRLWPRGLTKEKASVDLWLKDEFPGKLFRTPRFSPITIKNLTNLVSNRASS